MAIVWIIVVVLVLVLLWVVSAYNGLIALKNRVQEAWSDIDVQLKRRHDLIPNLIETVKGYAKHEKAVFEKVTELRTAAMSATSLKDKAETEGQLTDTLKSLFAVSENYPELKANQNFLQLQGELTDTEDKISAARRFYNGNVRDFNIAIESFPSNIVASIFQFKQMALFEITGEAEREAPKVSFDKK